MSLEVLVDVFSRSDTDFMTMFTGRGGEGEAGFRGGGEALTMNSQVVREAAASG